MPEWLYILISDPWAVLYAHGWVLAAFAAFGVLAWRSRTAAGKPADAASPRERSVFVVLAIGAELVILAQELVRDLAAVLFVSSDWTINFIWWKYSGPVEALAVSLAVGALLLRGARRDVEVRVPPVAARDWTTFSGRVLLVLACAALGLLALTSLFAGLNSSQAVDGHFRLLILSGTELYGNPAGQQTEGKDYFGWSYSGPTLALAAVGTISTWWFLRENALRPFPRPESVEAEVGALLGDGTHVSIGGEFEALSRVLLAVAALVRPAALTLILLGGTLGWLPELVAGRRRRAARSAAEPVTGASR